MVLGSMPLTTHAIRQQGIAYRYNGKNKRTPIGGVYIKAITSNNGEVSDDKDGTFTLVLNGIDMGSRIGNVQVTKRGMMVFNQQTVDEWSVRKDPLCLILCNVDEFQKQKDNLISIGRKEAEKKYKRRLAELEKLNNSKQLQIDDYNNKLDSLEQERQNALRHMDEYADVFARLDESEVDTIAQRAIEMFNRGEIEDAVQLLEEQNYMERLKHAIHTIEQADAMISIGEQVKKLAEQDEKKIIEGINTQIASYMLKNEWGKSKELLKGLADNLGSLDAIWNYADFCHMQNDFKEAEVYFLMCHKYIIKNSDIEETKKNALLACSKMRLALLYDITQRYSECEAMYTTALEICERNVELNSILFESDLAAMQVNIANFYCHTNRYSESEKMFKSALEIYERLSISNPSAFEYNLAKTQMSLALLFMRLHRFSESEEMFYSAMDVYEHLLESKQPSVLFSILKTGMNLADLYKETYNYSKSEKLYKLLLEGYECLAESNPFAFEPDLANIQMNLASLYKDTYCYSESETLYKSALEIYERLALTNPSTFEQSVGQVRMHIANLYRDSQRYSQSETMYKSVLEICTRLVQFNPKVFEAALASTQMNLALLYDTMQRYSESEELYKSTLEIYKRLVKINPSAFEPGLVNVYMNLANLYRNSRHYVEGEVMYKSALEIGERLAQSNSSAFEPGLISIYMNLANLYRDSQRYSESEIMYKSALEISERLARLNPSAFEPRVAELRNSLAMLYFITKRYSESEQMYRAALEICQHLAESNNYVFKSGVAKVQNGLATLYRTLQRYVESETMYEDCLKSYLCLYEAHAELYDKDLAECYFWLSSVKIDMGKNKEALESLEKFMPLAKELVKENKCIDIYEISLGLLSTLYIEEKNYSLADNINEELLQSLKKHYNEDADRWGSIYADQLVEKSFCANIQGNFKEGEKYSLEALKIDPSKHIAYTNLAAALLFQGKVEDAQFFYRQYKTELKDGFLGDLAEFERLGVIPKELKADVERIRVMINE